MFLKPAEIMKARQGWFTNRTRPQPWSALLSLFVALSLMFSPAHLCALMESAPGHSHETASAHSHQNDHHHAAAAQHFGGAVVQSVPDEHDCCSEGTVQPAVAAATSRFAAPNESSISLFFLPAMPQVQDIFALTSCHGRAGPPPDQPLRSQFLPSSLLGRAPPISA